MEQDAMPKGHEDRFLQKLDKALPKASTPSSHSWWKLAASVVIFLGIGYSVYQFSGTALPAEQPPAKQANVPKMKTMGDISPDLKKVEDYYLASINLELSKIELTPDNKEIFDGYVGRLDELQKEYTNLNIELTDNGPNPMTIDALINNLKLRLNLLYDLQDQLKRLNTDAGDQVQNII